jgi:hypothetical protein
VNFRYTNLRGADLRGADLRGADLLGADLLSACLRGANLCGANLEESNLRGVNLRDAELSTIKRDFWEILSAAQDEIPGLVEALKKGRVDGSVYIGACACLVGTIANIRGVAYDQMPNINPDSSRPAERWFLGIRKRDTPETNQISAITIEWIEEFLEREIGKVG